MFLWCDELITQFFLPLYMVFKIRPKQSLVPCMELAWLNMNAFVCFSLPHATHHCVYYKYTISQETDPIIIITTAVAAM